MDAIQLAAVLVSLALLASMVSIEVGVTVALVELTLGVVAGNAFHLESQDWLTFVAAFASIVLTFLAGMEVDPAYMRRRLDRVGRHRRSSRSSARSSSPRRSPTFCSIGVDARR